jgi:hypothetical protein
MILYHASDKSLTLEEIVLPGIRETCDFGAGFYTAVSKQTAHEWMMTNEAPIINEYLFDESAARILRLTGTDWIRVVVGFRTKAYKVHFVSSVICGAIADDRMDISLPLFMRGEIGDQRLLNCLNLCNLGEHYMFRDSLKGLQVIRSYKLKGQEMRNALTRNQARKNGMTQKLQQIRRQSVPGELFIEDYLAKGDFVIVCHANTREKTCRCL